MWYDRGLWASVVQCGMTMIRKILYALEARFYDGPIYRCKRCQVTKEQVFGKGCGIDPPCQTAPLEFASPIRRLADKFGILMP